MPETTDLQPLSQPIIHEEMAAEKVTATRVDPLDLAEDALALFIEQPPDEPDQPLLARMKLKAFIARAKDLVARIENDVLVPFIKKHGGFSCNTVRYYVGTPKTYKPSGSRGAVLEFMLTECGGDFERVTEFFSSDWIKPGEFRKAFGDEAFDRFFTTTEKDELKEGKPKKDDRLIELDTRYLK